MSIRALKMQISGVVITLCPHFPTIHADIMFAKNVPTKNPRPLSLANIAYYSGYIPI